MLIYMTLQLHDITPKASLNYGNEMSLKRKVIPDIRSGTNTLWFGLLPRSTRQDHNISSDITELKGKNIVENV
jgi:hypothetical protein